MQISENMNKLHRNDKCIMDSVRPVLINIILQPHETLSYTIYEMYQLRCDTAEMLCWAYTIWIADNWTWHQIISKHNAEMIEHNH